MVPRTFLGAAAVAALAWPARYAAWGATKLGTQIAGTHELRSAVVGLLARFLSFQPSVRTLDRAGRGAPVRAVLGAMVVGAHAVFRAAVKSVLGAGVAAWTAVLTVTQFHFLFYASRPLPNIFALVLGRRAGPRRPAAQATAE